jgi:hypothetical protein|tara:strand:- start:560 stop:778 length:219 start_codon:yes stop_codon:yes gene_type:complete
MGLPNKRDYFCNENIEFALLTLDSDLWDQIVKDALINQKIKLNSEDNFINEMEKALNEGEDFNAILKRFDNS